MFRILGVVILFCFISRTVLGEDLEQKKQGYLRTINRLESEIKNNPAHPETQNKRAELATAYFMTGILSKEEKPNWAKERFTKAAEIFEAVGDVFRNFCYRSLEMDKIKKAQT